MGKLTESFSKCLTPGSKNASYGIEECLILLTGLKSSPILSNRKLSGYHCLLMNTMIRLYILYSPVNIISVDKMWQNRSDCPSLSDIASKQNGLPKDFRHSSVAVCSYGNLNVGELLQPQQKITRFF